MIKQMLLEKKLTFDSDKFDDLLQKEINLSKKNTKIT